MKLHVIDLERHRVECTRCRPLVVCPVGARILEEAAKAWNEAAPMSSRQWGRA